MTTALTPQNKLGNIRSYLERKSPTLQRIAPKGTDIERIVSLACFEAYKNERLLDCSPESIYTSLAKACELNLVAGGVLHRAHLVPLYNKTRRCMEAELWIDYTGLMELVRRSGDVANFVARVVHKNEEFEHVFDLEGGEVLRHRPKYDGEPGEPVLAYAVCFFKDGQKQVEVMRRDQIERIRQSARSGNSGPWVTHTEEMWRKTVIRRICKYLPLTADAKAALEHDIVTDIAGQDKDMFVPDAVRKDLERDAGEKALFDATETIDADAPPAPKKKRKSRAKKVVEAAPAQPVELFHPEPEEEEVLEEPDNADPFA
jgi:recombination protein RecT